MRFVQEGEADAYTAKLRRTIAASMATQGLSLRSLAKLTGLTLSTVHRACRGGSAGNCNFATIYTICAALGIQFDRIEETNE